MLPGTVEKERALTNGSFQVNFVLDYLATLCMMENCVENPVLGVEVRIVVMYSVVQKQLLMA